jgi:hypothetical protein
MAKRPVFIPYEDRPPFVKEVLVEFKWYPGFAKSQAQKSIDSWHASAKRHGIYPIIEISSKSSQRLGVDLSAFNLMLKAKGHRSMSVECAFQGSKVFELGGPYTDLYTVSSREAKKDNRIRNSGDVIRFTFLGEDFPTTPLTAFYDWLYLKALNQNEILARQLLRYKGFTDIAFNPEKSFNCQARSAALFVALSKVGEINNVINDKEHYLALISDHNDSLCNTKPQSQLRLI